MNCCGEETQKEEKVEEHAPHAAQEQSHGGCCETSGGWMRWLMIAILLVAIASYFLK